MQNKTGVLITNLGTPNAPTAIAVRRYLMEFLADPYVVNIPRFIWLPLLYGIIAPLRAKKSAEAYQKIWTEEGSPLLTISQKIAQEIKEKFSELKMVELSMRYGSPSIADALEKMQQAKINKLIVLPLYPQYAHSTTASTFAAINRLVKKWSCIPDLRFINHYFDHPAYINALAESITTHQQDASNSKLLFSFHGLPEKSITKGDPYYFQCLKTAELVATKLRLAKKSWQVVFQSRFGRQQWLKPYCDKTLRELPSQGYKSVNIICPGFPADCLETLEEIAIRNKKIFLAAGGENFNYIPALNNSPKTLNLLAKLLDL